MELQFTGEVIEWRGPAPFVFVAVTPEIGSQIKALSKHLTYGWGCIPVQAKIGDAEFTTSLIPRAGNYLVPVKLVAQREAGLGIGDWVQVRLVLNDSRC